MAVDAARRLQSEAPACPSLGGDRIDLPQAPARGGPGWGGGAGGGGGHGAGQAAGAARKRHRQGSGKARRMTRDVQPAAGEGPADLAMDDAEAGCKGASAKGARCVRPPASRRSRGRSRDLCARMGAW